MSSETLQINPVRRPRARAAGRWLLDKSLNFYAFLVVLYLLMPLFVIVIFSFNDTHSRFNFEWHGFTLDHWADPFAVPELVDAMVVSLQVAALATIAATALGTLMALALVRYQFRAREASNYLVFIPMATPEVVMGAALLSLFLSMGVGTGFTTILIAHIMFDISFVVVVVRSRLIGFDRNLEEAAQDLGANSITTFFKVTLPLIAPGIIAAALLSFALSVDDFVITNFNAGSVVTFPLYIWGAAQRGIPVQVNIIASLIFLATLLAMAATVWQQRRAARLASTRPGDG